MTNQETNVTNAFETTLSSALSAGATTINVDSTTGAPAVPFYATIDPGDDSKREVVLVDSGKTATTLTLTGAGKRGQDGTSDAAHDSGAVVAVVPIAALWTDINDRVEGHTHSGGSDGTAIATGDLTGHDKAAHDALNIDADTVDGSHAADLLARANHTGTQAISTLSDHNKAAHDALTLDHGSLSGLSDDDHSQYALADGTRTWEVDGSTEVASQALTTSYAAVATVSLTIPANWATWKCEAYATYAATSPNDGDVYDARISIDGTAQQAKEGVTVIKGGTSGGVTDGAVGGRRTGVTTTGSRDFVLQMKEGSGGDVTAKDVYLYARAVRTS